MANTGASGTIKCPHCRQPVPEGSRFCLFCGAPVGSPGRSGRGRSLLALGLLAMLIGGLALAAWRLVSATGGGREGSRNVRPRPSPPSTRSLDP